MEKLEDTAILKMRSNTLEAVRRDVNLDKPGEMKEAVRILEEWVKQQAHFRKKDFPPHYLETTIVASKGSVERAKQVLDKLCTNRTLSPESFQPFDIKEKFELMRGKVSVMLTPKLTEDQHRFAIVKVTTFSSQLFGLAYKFVYFLVDYARMHDYHSGVVVIYDLSASDVREAVTNTNFLELKNSYQILTDSFSLRIKRIHFITDSKFVEPLLSLFKPLLKKKIADRVTVNKTVEELLQHYPKDVLPKDYGGNCKTLQEIQEDCVNELSSDTNKEFMRAMYEARTDESLRPQGQFTDKYAGAAGTFRLLVRKGVNMDSLMAWNGFLQMHQNTLEMVRRNINMDKPGEMKEAVRALEAWVNQQPHFRKKEFPPRYLENMIVASKGSLQRAKVTLEKVCTSRALLPEWLQPFNVKETFELLKGNMLEVPMPKMTSENVRVVIMKFFSYDADLLNIFYKCSFAMVDYSRIKDYHSSVVLIYDLTDGDLTQMMSKKNLLDLKNAYSLIVLTFAVRIKKIHLITTSKIMEPLLAIVKQFITKKIADRIVVNKSVEELHEYYPKDVLPKDYGGEDESLETLQGEYLNEISSEEYLEVMRQLYETRTDETLRPADEQHYGINGTFRALTID